ncbi:unnamed protein product [Oppiella nova]|uniref:Uncharacterized protein n=1 Tax=Oppiella nova TaxID=334625 RepID=A0A7R9LJV9_9ACAR|nr:unnamed protein product [Oppiella nova]CAG2164352.1 unnamed protein product [Oppiella nova]
MANTYGLFSSEVTKSETFVDQLVVNLITISKIHCHPIPHLTNEHVRLKCIYRKSTHHLVHTMDNTSDWIEAIVCQTSPMDVHNVCHLHFSLILKPMSAQKD